MSGGNRIELMTWDWKEYLDLEQLARVVDKVSGGTVHVHEVDTQSDQFAVFISNVKLTDDEVKRLWKQRWEGEE